MSISTTIKGIQGVMRKDAGVDGGHTLMDSDTRTDTGTETATHGDTGGDTGTNTGGGSDTDADTGTISDTDIGPLPLPEIQSPREDDIFRTDEAVEVSGMVSADAVAVKSASMGAQSTKHRLPETPLR